MLSAWVERRESGSASPLDRANAALLRADQAGAILTGAGDDCDGSQIEALVQRVALAASACGIATRNKESNVADAFAGVAETEAVTLDLYDIARLEGLPRASAFSA